MKLNWAALATRWRPPYVGTGAEGARRSADIDRDELGTLDHDDPRREAIEESIADWEAQAILDDAGYRGEGR